MSIEQVMIDENTLERLHAANNEEAFGEIMDDIVKRFPDQKDEIMVRLLMHAVEEANSSNSVRVNKMRDAVNNLAEALDSIREGEIEHSRKLTGLDSDLQVEAKMLYDACKAYCVHYNQIR